MSESHCPALGTPKPAGRQIGCPLAGSLEDALGTQSLKIFPRGLEWALARWAQDHKGITGREAAREKAGQREGVEWTLPMS